LPFQVSDTCGDIGRLSSRSPRYGTTGIVCTHVRPLCPPSIFFSLPLCRFPTPSFAWRGVPPQALASYIPDYLLPRLEPRSPFCVPDVPAPFPWDPVQKNITAPSFAPLQLHLRPLARSSAFPPHQLCHSLLKLRGVRFHHQIWRIFPFGNTVRLIAHQCRQYVNLAPPFAISLGRQTLLSMHDPTLRGHFPRLNCSALRPKNIYHASGWMPL
jgi:hypothetical protein